MNAVQIAHIAHAAGRALQIEQADATIPVSVGWKDLDEEAKRSLVEGVQGVLAGNTY